MAAPETKLVGIFPLQLVAFPGEQLNLHIFEARYKQLITECRDYDKTFVIPPYIQQEVMPFGTEMKLIKISNTYPDGKMDISVLGLRPVRIVELFNQYPGRLYGGAEVIELDLNNSGDTMLVSQITAAIKELYKLLDIRRPIPEVSATFSAFDVAHHIGLSTDQEFKLLTIPEESERQKYILQHLEHFIPLTRQMMAMQERAKQNGAFQNFDPIDWDID